MRGGNLPEINNFFFFIDSISISSAVLMSHHHVANDSKHLAGDV